MPRGAFDVRSVFVGNAVGKAVGKAVGCCVGRNVGVGVGSTVGSSVGCIVISGVGLSVVVSAMIMVVVLVVVAGVVMIAAVDSGAKVVAKGSGLVSVFAEPPVGASVVEADDAVVEVVVVLTVEFVDDLRKMNDSMQTNPSSFQELLTTSPMNQN